MTDETNDRTIAVRNTLSSNSGRTTIVGTHEPTHSLAGGAFGRLRFYTIQKDKPIDNGHIMV